MKKIDAQKSTVKITTELMSANPSALITLWELDLSDLLMSNVLELRDRNVIVADEFKVFRFHNNINLTTSKITWKGKTYIPAPILADGFETSAKGTMPKPKLTLYASEEAIAELSILKTHINLGELIGAKITRIRTFAKYLDEENFIAFGTTVAKGGTIAAQRKDEDYLPDGFDPDVNAEFPRDVYYIDRKSAETKQVIEFELSSAIDIENIKLPYRRVVQGTCQWQYRGEGCMYEYGGSNELIAIDPNSWVSLATDYGASVYNHIPYWMRNEVVAQLKLQYGFEDEETGASTMSNRSDDVHGQLGTSKLPIVAPPIANSNDEIIFTIRNEAGFVLQAGLVESLPETQPVEWTEKEEYPVSTIVFLKKNGISYYFVAKQDVPRNTIPPNDIYWIQDECSKTLRGCSLRWARPFLTTLGMGHLIGDKVGNLPFGGFPAVNK